MALVAIEVAMLCLACGVYFTLENPSSSLIWLLTEMLSLTARSDVYVLELDYCCYGTAWRKPLGTRASRSLRQPGHFQSRWKMLSNGPSHNGHRSCSMYRLAAMVAGELDKSWNHATFHPDP